jgi:hypothetical protein
MAGHDSMVASEDKRSRARRAPDATKPKTSEEGDLFRAWLELINMKQLAGRIDRAIAPLQRQRPPCDRWFVIGLLLLFCSTNLRFVDEGVSALGL